MHTLFALLASRGYVILAAFVVAEQVPLPVPAVPVLLGIGALAADGRMSIVAAGHRLCGGGADGLALAQARRRPGHPGVALHVSAVPGTGLVRPPHRPSSSGTGVVC